MAKKRSRSRTVGNAPAAQLSWTRADVVGLAILLTSVTSIAPPLPDGNVFAARSACLLGAGVLWLALYGLGHLRHYKRQSIFLIGTALIVGAMLASTAAAKYPLSNFMDGMGSSMGVVTWVALLAIAVGAAGVKLDSRMRMWLMTAFAWVLPVAFAAVMQRLSGQPITGPLQNDNFFGLVMLSWLPVSAGLALTSSSPNGRTAWWAACAFLSTAVLVSGGQSASAVLLFELGAICALMGPAMWPARSRSLRLAGWMIAALAGAAILSIAVGGAFGPDGLRWLPEGIQRALETRAYLWNGALKIFMDAPLLGSGPDGYMYAAQAVTQPELMRLEHGTQVIDVIAADPHSIYLRSLSNLGLIGLVALATTLAGWLQCSLNSEAPTPQALALRHSLMIGGAGFLLGAAFAPWTVMIGGTPALVLGLAAAQFGGSAGLLPELKASWRWAICAPLSLLLLLSSGSHLIQERLYTQSNAATSPAEKERLLQAALDAAPWDHSMHYLRLRARGELAGIVGADVYSFQRDVDSDPFAPKYGPFLADLARLSIEDATMSQRRRLDWERRALDRAAELSPAIPEVWAERVHLAVATGDRDAILAALKEAEGRAESAARWPMYLEAAQRALATP